MPQFTPQSPLTPFPSQDREASPRLRLSQGHFEESTESVYHQRQQETQRIKKLSFWANKDQEPQEEEEWTERQSAAPFILALIILVVASTLLWFLFQWASNENTSAPLVIPADTAPFKVRPENPGGMTIPHQDKLVYSRLSQNAAQPIERLLPPPEQPMAAPAMPHHPSGYGSVPQPHSRMAPQHYYPQEGYQQNPHQAPQQNQGYAQPQGYSPPPVQQPFYPDPSFSPVHGDNPQAYPQFQEAPPQVPQQQLLANQPPYGPPPSHKYAPYGPPAPIAPVGPMPPLAPPQQPMAPSPSKVSNVEDIKPASSHEEDDSTTDNEPNELDQLIAREAAIPFKKNSPKGDGKQNKVSSLDPRTYRIQLASLPSRTLAEQEMRRLRMLHGSSLGNKPWAVQKVNTNRGPVHRLLLGSFPNHNAAMKLCGKLRSGGTKCQVISPADE